MDRGFDSELKKGIVTMKNIDYYIVTREYVLAKVENRDWQRYKLQDYYPEKLPKRYPIGPFDIFDHGDVFINTMSKVIKSTNRSFMKRIKNNHLIIYVVDELDSMLRKCVFLDGFSKEYHGQCYLFEIAPTAVSAMYKDDYKKASIVVAVIGNIMELSFCFGGSRILMHVVETDFWTDFNMFIDKAREYQNKSLEECMELERFEESDKNELLQLWAQKNKFSYILVSNNDPEDAILDSRFKPDHSTNYTDIVTYAGTVFKEISGMFKKQTSKRWWL